MIRETTDAAEIEEATGQPAMNGWRYFLAYRGDRRVGFVCAEPIEDGETWVGHMQLGADSGGMASRYARQAARSIIASGGKRVLGLVPEHNLRSLRAAIGAGFRYIGRSDGHHVTEYR